MRLTPPYIPSQKIQVASQQSLPSQPAARDEPFVELVISKRALVCSLVHPLPQAKGNKAKATTQTKMTFVAKQVSISQQILLYMIDATEWLLPLYCWQVLNNPRPHYKQVAKSDSVMPNHVFSLKISLYWKWLGNYRLAQNSMQDEGIGLTKALVKSSIGTVSSLVTCQFLIGPLWARTFVPAK